MDITLYLVNRDIETVSSDIFDADFSDDLVYKGKDKEFLKEKAKGYPMEELTVISCGSNFFTGYSYKSWLRRFGK